MASTANRRIDWVTLVVVVGVHVLAAAAVLPWLFSWTGVVLAVAGLYLFGTIGINLCYHRLLTHRSFKCPLWLEHGLAIVGVCCLQRSPGLFVTTHRLHHQHSDTESDPHTPMNKLFWGHMGWLFVANPEVHSVATCVQYAKDIYRDPFYLRLEKGLLWLWVYAAHAVAMYLVGFSVGYLLPGGSLMAGVQFGLSLLVWGVLLRTVMVWHITWCVNSLGHVWGYRNYETRDNSRNSLFAGLISNGDGWHNNHHHDQRSAAHGHRWFELDVTYLTIKAMQLVGLVWDVIPRQVESQPQRVADERTPMRRAA